MGALDRDYWKKPQNKKSNNTPQKNNKMQVIISEYNKNVSFFNRYIKMTDMVLWNIILLVASIFMLIIFTT